MLLSEMVVTEFVGYVEIPVTDGYTRTICSRPSSAIMVMEKGIVEYYHQGKTYISDEHHVLLIPEGLFYKLRATSTGISPQINFRSKERIPGIISYPIAESQEVLRICRSLQNKWTFQKRDAMLRIMKNVYDILAHVQDQQAEARDPHNVEIIGPSVRYMEKHLTDPTLNNDILARESNISTVYFRKLFTKQFGESPMRYIRLKRIERAQELLDSHLLSITEVAELAGFGSVYYFSNVFREATGLSPSEWLKKREG